MNLKTANYVSQVRHRQLAAAGGLVTVLQQSRRRNAAESVTGTLIFTGKHFVQAIEGPDIVIDGLLARLRKDDRHTIIAEFGCQYTDERRYRSWGLGYAGTSVFVSRMVETTLAMLEVNPDHEPDQMVEIMVQFAG